MCQRRPRSRRLPADGNGLDGDLKITILAPHVRIAGGVRAMLSYADRLAARGHAVTVVVPGPGLRRALWRRLRGVTPPWMPDLRARLAWVSRWRPEALPDADVLVATAWQSSPVVAAAPARCGERFYLVQRALRPAPRGLRGEAARGRPVYDEFHANPPQAALAAAVQRRRHLPVPIVHEGLGMPSMEAMACGAALVTYDNGGSRDYARDGVTALVARPRDVADRAAKLEQLAADAARRGRIAAAGTRLVTTAFDWELAVARLESLFREAAPAHADRP